MVGGSSFSLGIVTCSTARRNDAGESEEASEICNGSKWKHSAIHWSFECMCTTEPRRGSSDLLRTVAGERRLALWVEAVRRASGCYSHNRDARSAASPGCRCWNADS